MLSYYEFINEAKDTKEKLLKPYFSHEFKNLISNIGDDISFKLKRIEETNTPILYTHISLSDDNNSVLYYDFDSIRKILLKENDEVNPNNINQLLRAMFYLRDGLNIKYKPKQIKIGKFIKNIFGDAVTAKELETFVNKFKSLTDTSNDKFEVIEGDEIKKWYLCDNYENLTGSLGNSCMKYKRANQYMNFYALNPKKVKMIILKNSTGDKINGRALLWYLDKPKDKIFMDRVYVDKDYLIHKFIKYAQENNYIYKRDQIYGGTPVVDGDEIINNLDMDVTLISGDYDYYPYLDTLIYYNIDTGLINNYSDDDDCITLTDTEGHYEGYDDDDDMVEDYVGNMIYRDDAIWCEKEEEWCYVDDARYVDSHDSYYTPNYDGIVYDEYNVEWIYRRYATLTIHNEWVKDDDVIESKYQKGYIIKDDSESVVTPDGEEDVVEKELAVYSDYYDAYIIKDEAEEHIINDKPNYYYYPRDEEDFKKQYDIED